MTDNGLAALAAALAPLLPQHQEGSGGYPHQSSHRTWTVYDFMPPDTLAAAILGECGVFLPDGLPPEIEGYYRVLDDAVKMRIEIEEQAATIATLRAALDAGATLLGYMDYGRMRVGGDEANRAYLAAWRAARAALATAREVNAIVAAERERIVAEVKALPTLVLPTGTYVDVEDVFDVIEP